MAPSKRAAKSKPGDAHNALAKPPAPFKQLPEDLKIFTKGLSKKHIYITHLDCKPSVFKRKIFLVPVAMNACISLLFIWRMYTILPWYWKLLISVLGYRNETTFAASEATWVELFREIGVRSIVMFIDFVLFIFIWPWPVTFAVGRNHGSPMRWRLKVGFRDEEIYVRRSRDWDVSVGRILDDARSRQHVIGRIEQATSPLLQEQKTGYLLMDKDWDLDWDAMVQAHSLIDAKTIAIETFRNVVLLHHGDHGWLRCDIKTGGRVDEDDRKVFAFRDALTAMGKEDLFYRWIEIVQFEATQPGGFGVEKQEAAASRIRAMFEAKNVDFDQLWKETAGTIGL